MESGNKNGNTVMLTVIGIATLLVALVGATFSYFIATANNENQQKVEVSTGAAIGLVYSAPTAITATGILPGDVIAPATFTVENTNNSNSSTMVFDYDLDLKIDSNNFVNITNAEAEAAGTGNKQLMMSITQQRSGQGIDNAGNSSSSENLLQIKTPLEINLTDSQKLYDSTTKLGAASNSTIPVVHQQRIYIGEKHTYNIAMTFNDYQYDQNLNSNKSLVAHIEIGNINSSSTTGTPEPTE